MASSACWTRSIGHVCHSVDTNGFRMITSPTRCPTFKSSVHNTDAWAFCAAVTRRASQNENRYRSDCFIAQTRSVGRFHDDDGPLQGLLDNVASTRRIVRNLTWTTLT